MLLIVTPTMGRPTSQFLVSLLMATQELRAAGIRHRVLIIDGVTPIQFARNEAVNAFHSLEEATHMLMVDDDMVFTASDILSLLGADKPVVAALCPLRMARAAYNAEPSTNTEVDGDLASVNAVGTGFMLIARNVIEEWVAEQDAVEMKSGEKRWALFDCSIDDTGKYVSEDYTFCNRVRARGHKVWVHTALNIGHVGTHVFRPRHTSAQRLELLKGAWSE